MNFRGKILVISGTNSGIGKAYPELLLDRDATVIGIE